MALNPQYDAIGKAFVQQYYTIFDDAAQRHQLSALYNVSSNVYRKGISSGLNAITYDMSAGFRWGLVLTLRVRKGGREGFSTLRLL